MYKISYNDPKTKKYTAKTYGNIPIAKCDQLSYYKCDFLAAYFSNIKNFIFVF